MAASRTLWLLIVLPDMTLPAIVLTGWSCRERIERLLIWYLAPCHEKHRSSTATMSTSSTSNIVSEKRMNSLGNILEQQLNGESMNTISKSSQLGSMLETGSGTCTQGNMLTGHQSGQEIIPDPFSSSGSFHHMTTSFNERRGQRRKSCTGTTEAVPRRSAGIVANNVR